MPSHRLHVKMLGGIAVTVDGRAIRICGRHGPALVALLALERRPRSRDAIIADLWQDGGSAACLRQTLWLVRSGLTEAGFDPDAILVTDADGIGFASAVRLTTDVARFERVARGGDADPEAAVAIYRGDLLAGLDYECFAAERERLADLFEDNLAIVAARRRLAGDFGGARLAAEQLLLRDPLREEAHAVLIAVFGGIGSRAQVVRQYRRLAGVLRRELDVDPLPETELAYRTALQATVDRSRAAVASQLQSVRQRVGRTGGRPMPAGRLALVANA